MLDQLTKRQNLVNFCDISFQNALYYGIELMENLSSNSDQHKAVFNSRNIFFSFEYTRDII